MIKWIYSFFKKKEDKQKKDKPYDLLPILSHKCVIQSHRKPTRTDYDDYVYFWVVKKYNGRLPIIYMNSMIDNLTGEKKFIKLKR